MKLIACIEERHAAAILDIFNDAIVHSTALYDYKPRAPETMGPWFAAKQRGGWPVIGAEDEHGTLLGFASYGTFRAWPAYKYTVEHSVYIHAAHRRQGLGALLLNELMAQARRQEVHTLVGCIDAANAASIALHQRLGFQHAGTIREAAFKFGRWLDLAFYQRCLETPRDPVDG